jgi:hypothetical protein
MRVIELNAQNWRTVLDYYDSLKEALGSPSWHGSSPDAWIDSMIYGGINEVKPHTSFGSQAQQTVAIN